MKKLLTLTIAALCRATIAGSKDFYIDLFDKAETMQANLLRAELMDQIIMKVNSQRSQTRCLGG